MSQASSTLSKSTASPSSADAKHYLTAFPPAAAVIVDHAFSSTTMRIPTLTTVLLVLTLVICASAQKGDGNGPPAPGSRRLANPAQARQAAKQIEGRVKGRKAPSGRGGSGKFSRALGALRGLRRGDRAQAQRALRERASGGVAAVRVGVTRVLRQVVTQTHRSWKETFGIIQFDRWWFAGVWANGGVFGNGFEPDFYSNDNSEVTLPLAKEDFYNPDSAGSGVPGQTYNYTGSEIRSQEVDYGFGCYSWCARPTRTSGVVSSLYVYSAGVWDTPWEGVSVPHREIDIEFLVSDGVVKMQSNMFNDPDWSSGTQKTFEEIHDIPSSEFHTYSFKWHKNYIEWYIDGVAVRKIENKVDATPQQEQQTMRLMMNAYSVDQNNPDAVNWAGAIPIEFSDDAIIIKWFRFKKGGRCVPEKTCIALG